MTAKLTVSVLGTGIMGAAMARKLAANRSKADQDPATWLPPLADAVHQESDGTYGASRITAELRETGGEAVNLFHEELFCPCATADTTYLGLLKNPPP